MCLLKTSRDLDISFTAVPHFDEELNPWDITDIKGGKVPKLLCGYTQTNSIHNRIVVKFVIENVN
jgi:hypothetical protein